MEKILDIITAKNYLDQQGTLESVGGIDYLTQLSGAGATVVNVEQYAKIVHENALRRDLIALGQDITDKAFIEDLDTPVSRQIELAEQKLFDMATAGASEREVTSISTALQTAFFKTQTQNTKCSTIWDVTAQQERICLLQLLPIKKLTGLR